jgi:hypothetical protein
MIASVFQQNDSTYTIINESGSWTAHIYCPNGELRGSTATTVSIYCPLENTLKIFNEQGNQISSAYVPSR